MSICMYLRGTHYLVSWFTWRIKRKKICETWWHGPRLAPPTAAPALPVSLDIVLLSTHHSDQVATSVLSDQLLLPILLHDDGPQSTTQHDEGTVGLLLLPEDTEA